MDTPKQQALDLIATLPHDSSWQEILEKLHARMNTHERQLQPDWDDLVRRVRTVLYDEFPDADDLKLKQTADGQSLSGYLVSREFDGMENPDRQDRVWDVLEKNLSVEEQSRILSVIALAPDENVPHEVE